LAPLIDIKPFIQMIYITIYIFELNTGWIYIIKVELGYFLQEIIAIITSIKLKFVIIFYKNLELLLLRLK